MSERFRVASVQYELKPVECFDDFLAQVADQIRVGADYGSKLVLLPEYLSLQLLSLYPKEHPQSAVRKISELHDEYLDFLRTTARASSCYVLGGTFPVIEKGALYNRALLASPRGNFGAQDKLRMTRFENEDWDVAPGEALRIFETSLGKIAVNTCYDSEFPELARSAALSGATLLLVPSCTDCQYAYQRVRFCCRARAVENQMYVVQSVTVGGLRGRPAAALNYGSAAIFTPSDFGFPPEGISSEGPLNLPAIVMAELDFDALEKNRAEGSVRPLLDHKIALPDAVPVPIERLELE